MVRIVAIAVMLEGIALLAIVTSAITSSFVERAQRAYADKEDAEDQLEHEHLDARFETLLRTLTKSP